ncbi:BamA/TamA family outer membrane protein [Candidatus Eisenbacteria bacterium]|uniref:BamA/TamA family outer membrane protein n=1 Tax=Eiseniibacteriota bacterium TaxID=2212470 RepID=A0ABV6YPV1_UNCEI
MPKPTGKSKPTLKSTLILTGIVCLCVLSVASAGSFPLKPGTYDEDNLGKQKQAQKVLEELNMKMNIESDDVVRIGESFTVGRGETIEGDIVIIGGGLTIKGNIEGDAVVIGGSMYLESSATVKGDAAVMGGLLQKEDGATVLGSIVENPETSYSSYLSGTYEAEKELKEAQLEIKMAEKELEAHETLLAEGVRDDVVKFGGSIHILEGETVDGDVVAIGGDIRIDGFVTGDVVTSPGDITIGSSGYVEGDALATFGKIAIEPGGSVEGEITEVSLGGARTFPHVNVGNGKYSSGETTYLISLERPDADEVMLTGSFIDWDEDGIEMEEDGKGVWKTSISLGPGEYQYKFIVDDVWMTDPDIVEQVPDGRGGFATPIIVEGKRTPSYKKGDKDGTIVFSLHRPEADEITLIGSWDNWDPDGTYMERDSEGTFKAMVPLSAGLHTYKFCVDGRCIPDPDEPDKVVWDRHGDKVTSVVVKPRDYERVLINFLHDRPDVSDMRVTGTFNGWDDEGIPMYQDEDGVWFTYVAIPAGTQKYKFYLDGRWMPDPDVEEAVPDGRGGYATEFEVRVPRKRSGTTVTMSMDDWKDRKGFNFAPAFDYNRVDGVYLAGVLRYGSKQFPEPSFYVEGGYSKKRDRGLYKVELEQPMYEPLDLWLGGSFYSLTWHYDQDLITDWENLVATLFAFDYRDYFDYRGIQGFTKIGPWPHHTFKLAYMGDEYRPLERKASTTLFRGNRKFPENPRNSYQIGYDPEWGGTNCDMIKIRALELGYEYDTRNCKSTPTGGFLVKASGEWSRQDWGSTYDYNRFEADIRHYRKIAPKQIVTVRLKGGVYDVQDSEPCGCAPDARFFFPKQFAVGGIGTMPGYTYKQFRGTHMLLANMEYTYNVWDESGVVFMLDAGDATGEPVQQSDGTWFVREDWKDLKIRWDAGVGLRYESSCDYSLSLAVVQRLDDLDLGSRVIIRGTRIF